MALYFQFGYRLPALLLALGCVAPVLGADPEIRNIALRGLQIDGSTKLVIDGDGFGTNPTLLLPFKANVSLKTGATDKQATFDVQLGADVMAGYHHLRLVNGSSISFPLVIAVDRLPQVAMIPKIERLPAALHGAIVASAIAETSFAGKAGQKITIEVEAQRLGSKLRPVIHLYGPKRLQIEWAWGTPSLQGDARLETTLPDDGDYRIAIHDAEYQAVAPGFFRLRVGAWSFVDQVFPPVVGKNTASVELLGSETVRAELPAAREAHWLPLAWPKQGAWSGPRPFVETSSRLEILGQPASAKPQELPGGSVGVCGRLAVPFAEDRYRVPVVAGSKVRFEVFAERLGSPLDAALVIRNDSGAELARVEDGVGTLDPTIEYTVPAKVNSVVVGVVDSQGRGGNRGLYRLTIDPLDAAGRSDFELVTPERRLSVSAGGRTVFPVWVERRGYRGPIELKPDGLPAGLKTAGLTIPAGADGTLVSLTAEQVPSPAITSWHGRADDGRERAVVQKNHPMERLQPWLAAELGLGGSASKGSNFQIDWKDPKADDVLVFGRRKALPVKLTRTGPAGPVRITLLTSQPPIMLANNAAAVDPARNIRLERVLLELPAAAKEGEVPLLAPIDLPADLYDLAVQAEFLTADKKTVTAVAVTPVQRFRVVPPIGLKLDGPSRIDVTVKPKMPAVFEIAGTVQRAEGLATDVRITLTGLPAGAKAEPLTVKAGVDPFKLKVTLPATVKPGVVEGLKLSGAIVPAPKMPRNLRLRNEDVELSLNIVAGK